MFMSKLFTKVEQNEEITSTVFQIGYFQVDNQSEADPIYPVLLKPNILDYDAQKDKIILNKNDKDV